MLQEQVRTCGALDRGSPCRLSILRNANIANLLCPSHMSNLINSPVTCHKKVLLHSIGPMWHVKFKNRMCHPVHLEVKGHTFIVSIIQAEITRNQLPGMLGGNSNLT